MKYLFLLILLLNGLFASSSKFIEEMNYESIYEKALEKAKIQNKTLMMIVSTKECPWCRKLERQTLKKENIAQLIKNNFVALSVDKEKKNYPKKYEVKVVPTIFFIDAKSEQIINKTLGYKNKKDFLELLRTVENK